MSVDSLCEVDKNSKSPQNVTFLTPKFTSALMLLHLKIFDNMFSPACALISALHENFLRYERLQSHHRRATRQEFDAPFDRISLRDWRINSFNVNIHMCRIQQKFAVVLVTTEFCCTLDLLVVFHAMKLWLDRGLDMTFAPYGEPAMAKLQETGRN